MPDPKTHLFVVHPACSPEIGFDTIEPLRQWIQEQQSAFEWFTNEKNNGNQFGGLTVEAIRQYFNTLRTRADQAFANPLDTHIDDVRRTLRNWRSEGPRFTGTDSRIAYCRSLFEKNKELGLRTLLAFMSGTWGAQQGVGTDRKAFEAGLHVSLFELALTSNSVPSRASEVDELARELKKQIEGAKDDRSKSLDRMAECVEQLISRVEKLEVEQRAKVDSFQKILSERIDSTDKEFSAFKQAVLEDITLQAPVKYWQDRAGWMAVTATVAGAIWVVLFCVLMIFVVKFGTELMNQTLDLAHRIWTITVSLAILGFAAWPLRIVARIYMSALHLRADAQERRTMVMTYLALLEEGRVDEKHREIVLAALFRPSPTGIVSDDGAPSAFAEILKAVKPGS